MFNVVKQQREFGALLKGRAHLCEALCGVFLGWGWLVVEVKRHGQLLEELIEIFDVLEVKEQGCIGRRELVHER